MTRDLKRAFLLPFLLAAAGGAPRAEATLPPALPGLGDAGSGRWDEAPQIGPYRLRAELGAGGMGTVYLAEQREPVHRLVALKTVRGDGGDPGLRARFELERQALAVTNHDHVARLFDAGTAADGELWYAMEFVPGEPLTEYCDRHRLDVPARLRLLARVCDAVQHLHELGIHHRDLKPENVLVVHRDGEPVPKIIDLGLAAVAGRGSDQQDGLLGTPTHMAPEQFRVDSGEVDGRADVHALGVMLYQLLVGALPYAPVDWSRPGGVRSLSLARPVATPSERLRASDVDAGLLGERRRTSARGLARTLRGGLDRIAGRSVAAAPGDRQASPGRLADELRGWTERRERFRRVARCAIAVGSGVLGGLLAAALL